MTYNAHRKLISVKWDTDDTDATPVPGHQALDGVHVCKPAKDATRSIVNAHIRKQCEHRREDDGHIRETVRICPSKYFGRFAYCL